MNHTTYHCDNLRTGWNPREHALTVASVPHLELAFTQPVDGQVYAQPLYVRDLVCPEYGPRDVVFVATEKGTVYAFDARVPDPLTPGRPGPYWKRSLVPTGERPLDPNHDLDHGCDDLTPSVCITATPVIDLSPTRSTLPRKRWLSVEGVAMTGCTLVA